MFFILSKTISFILKPLGILFILGFLLLLTKNRTKQKRLTITILVLLYIFSCPVIINTINRLYEPKTLQIKNLGNYDAGVVLTGGIINDSKYGENHLGLGNQSDRIWQALELYREKKIKRIIISGGEWRKNYQKQPLIENDYARLFLLKNGVPDSLIFQEKTSKNTFENALETKKLLNIEEKVLVITTSFHCKRASLCFRKQGIDFTMFPVNSEIAENHSLSISAFLPSSLAFRQTDLLFTEWIGLLAYKLAGYI